jgi:hypothetical protein
MSAVVLKVAANSRKSALRHLADALHDRASSLARNFAPVCAGRVPGWRLNTAIHLSILRLPSSPTDADSVPLGGLQRVFDVATSDAWPSNQVCSTNHPR